jgi:hypothetical protein
MHHDGWRLRLGERLALAIAIGAALLAVAPAASASDAHTTISWDLTGAVIACPSHTFTVTSGVVALNLLDVTSASGNTVSTTTPSADGSPVRLVDQNGAAYVIRGVIVFHQTTNASTGGSEATYVARLPIVGPGGLAEVDLFMYHESPNGSSFSFDFGTCTFD